MERFITDVSLVVGVLFIIGMDMYFNRLRRKQHANFRIFRSYKHNLFFIQEYNSKKDEWETVDLDFETLDQAKNWVEKNKVKYYYL